MQCRIHPCQWNSLAIAVTNLFRTNPWQRRHPVVCWRPWWVPPSCRLQNADMIFESCHWPRSGQFGPASNELIPVEATEVVSADPQISMLWSRVLRAMELCDVLGKSLNGKSDDAVRKEKVTPKRTKCWMPGVFRTVRVPAHILAFGQKTFNYDCKDYLWFMMVKNNKYWLTVNGYLIKTTLTDQDKLVGLFCSLSPDQSTGDTFGRWLCVGTGHQLSRSSPLAFYWSNAKTVCNCTIGLCKRVWQVRYSPPSNIDG